MLGFKIDPHLSATVPPVKLTKHNGFTLVLH